MNLSCGPITVTLPFLSVDPSAFLLLVMVLSSFQMEALQGRALCLNMFLYSCWCTVRINEYSRSVYSSLFDEPKLFCTLQPQEWANSMNWCQSFNCQIMNVKLLQQCFNIFLVVTLPKGHYSRKQHIFQCIWVTSLTLKATDGALWISPSLPGLCSL